MLDEHQRTFARAVHFSFKTTNSNAASGGVRVDTEDALDLPYLSARTLLAEGQRLELDYTGNAAVEARHFKHAQQVLGLLEASESDLSAQELATLAQLFREQTAGHFELHCDTFIDPRMRQLLLPCKSPTGHTEYLSISPLTAAGLCKRTTQQVEQTNERTQQAKEKAKSDKQAAKSSTRRVLQARNALVGSNPQNVGRLVREMQSPIYCQAPASALDTRAALAIHYQGPHLAIPEHRLLNYADFLRRVTNAGIRASNAELRAEEIELLTAMVDDLQAQAKEARYLLEEHQALFPVDANGVRCWFAPQVAAVLVGWVLPESRHHSWTQQAAQWMSAQMRAATVKSTHLPLMPLDDYGLHEVAHLLEGIL